MINAIYYIHTESLRVKKNRDKNSLFALEKPADFTSEKRRIDALIGYIIIFTSEQTMSPARRSS